MGDELWIKQLKERLKDYSESPSPTGWERLERELSPAAPVNEERRQGKYDHAFVFTAEKKAVVECAGLRLTVDTDRPAMQLYTGEFNPNCSSLWPHSGPFCALALETSEWPDAVNRSDFPSAVLEPGKVFKSRTSYTVEEV